MRGAVDAVRAAVLAYSAPLLLSPFGLVPHPCSSTRPQHHQLVAGSSTVTIIAPVGRLSTCPCGLLCLPLWACLSRWSLAPCPCGPICVRHLPLRATLHLVVVPLNSLLITSPRPVTHSRLSEGKRKGELTDRPIAEIWRRRVPRYHVVDQPQPSVGLAQPDRGRARPPWRPSWHPT